MRTPPCCMEQRSRYLLQKHTTLTNQKRHRTINSKIIKEGISLRGQNLRQARKKIAKCTQLYSKIRSSELIMLIYFTRFTIETKYVRKTIYIHIRCREKDQQMQEMQKI